MKWFPLLTAGAVCLSFACAAAAQTRAPQPASPASAPQTAQPSSPNSHVIFSRSQGDAAAKAGPAAEKSPSTPPSFKITDAERSAVAFTAYDLDTHLTPHSQSLAVRARITLRNAGEQPLTRIALQLSSSLDWEAITLDAKPIAFTVQTVNSDADHTGQFREADFLLPQPLAPHASLTLQATYSGPIVLNSKRLEQIGTPTDVAQHSDWDQISDDFTGLRGFGNVAWYPVSSIPVALGDGNKLFAEIGAQKLRNADAMVTLNVTEEFYGIAPNVAVLDGEYVPIAAPTVAPTETYPGILHCALPATHLGFATPILVLAQRTPIETGTLRFLPLSNDSGNILAWKAAATSVEPLLQQWLGSKPSTTLTLLDLPSPGDSPYEAGSVLLTTVGLPDSPKLPSAELAPTLAHALAHSWFQSPRPWLNEGVAYFLGTLWTEQSQGRQTALDRLGASGSALALVEPSDPGTGTGEDLLHASSDIYYRNKACYVLWMLRDLAGDGPLSAALRAYKPADDTTPDYFERLLEKSSGKDLRWFFDDWVYRDRGLPDLSIASVFPSRAAAGQTLVAVDVANDGYAAAEVPLTVRSDKTSLTQRVYIPARSHVTHRVLLQGEPTEVLLNDGTVPEVQATLHQHTITNTPAP